jgi:hypothetical protein
MNLAVKYKKSKKKLQNYKKKKSQRPMKVFWLEFEKFKEFSTLRMDNIRSKYNRQGFFLRVQIESLTRA